MALKTHNYRELNIWKKSRELVKVIYLITEEFPKSELYGLVSQMRRCSVSVPSNIAEGSGRGTDKSFANFVSYSIASSYELETQCWLSIDVGFTNEKEMSKVINEITDIQRMLHSFRKMLLN